MSRVIRLEPAYAPHGPLAVWLEGDRLFCWYEKDGVAGEAAQRQGWGMNVVQSEYSAYPGLSEAEATLRKEAAHAD